MYAPASYSSRLRREVLRISAGKLQGPLEFFRLSVLLWAIAAGFFAVCWMLHPAECEVSIIKDTISHFGKPDKHAGSFGFLFFHFGFATLCMLMFISVKYRHRQLNELPGHKTARTTELYVAGILCLVLSLVFPDSKLLKLGTISFRKLHGIVVVIGIFCFAIAILADTRQLWSLFSFRKKERNTTEAPILPRRLLPVAIFGATFFVGLTFIGIWEIRCMFDPTLDPWPGDGIFSTALWEWIVFTYLLIFMFWYPLGLSTIVQSRGGMSGLQRWRLQ